MICVLVRKTLNFNTEVETGLNISTLLRRKLVALLVLVFLSFSFGMGQDKSILDVYFEIDTVQVENGTTFSNLLVFKNSGSEPITIQELAPQQKYPGLIYFPKAAFELRTGEEKRFPVKFIANLDFLKMASDTISFAVTWNSSTMTQTQRASFFISKTEDKTIAISPFSRENYLHPGSPESTISLFVENRGFSTRSIKLDFQSLPAGLEITPNQQTLSLEGQEKRMIEINVSIRRQNSLFPEYKIQVQATDLTGNENVGNSNIRLVLLSANRQIVPSVSQASGSNFAEIAINEYSTGQNHMFLKGNREFAVTEDMYGRLNLSADYYLQNGLYNLYDTWLELERNNSMLRVGNVFGSNYDYSISGRGGKFVTKLAPNREIEVLALENNYHLLGTYFPQGEGAKMVGGKYQFGGTNSMNGKVSYLFDHDPRQSINSHVANFVSSFDIRDQHNIGLEAGVSSEKGLLARDQNQGFTAGIHYDTRSENWGFQSQNSYATKSYAGLSRGAFNTVQRIERQFDNSHRAYILYQNSQVQPEYLVFQSQPDYVRPDYFYSTQALKTGYQFSVRDWNFLISPQVVKQKNAYNSIENEFMAYRFHTNIGTSFGSHGLNFSNEYSYANAERDLGWFHGLKANMSYRYKGFSLNGAVQWNPNSVIDLNSYYYNDQNFVNYNFYTSYNFHALKRTLSGSISAGTNYSELYENLNQNLTGNLEYKVSSSWSVTGYFNYSDYRSIETDGYRGKNYQLRFGVKKYFNIATAIANHKVSFVIFEDANFNGMLDADEVVLSNEVIRLDNHVAITDERGKVTFQNVPDGTYTLKVNERAGSRLTIDSEIAINRNVNMNVGLVKNIRITGRLSEVRQPYDELETDVTGVLVYAKNHKGNIQKAVVNKEKEFEFFLKDGTYEIYIKNDQFEYQEPVKWVKVDGSSHTEDLVFEYAKKDRTIKIKKF